MSPHFALASLSTPGLGQMIFGQVAKGWTILAAAIVIAGMFPPIFFLVPIIATIDAYTVGKKTNNNVPVTTWAWFP